MAEGKDDEKFMRDLNEEFVDFQLDEDAEFDEQSMQGYENYESTEIEVPDDINLEDLEGVDIPAPAIPVITFVDETKIQTANDDGNQILISKDIDPDSDHSDQKNAEQKQRASETIKFRCEKCGKPYKRAYHYEKHINICSMYLYNSK